MQSLSHSDADSMQTGLTAGNEHEQRTLRRPLGGLSSAVRRQPHQEAIAGSRSPTLVWAVILVVLSGLAYVPFVYRDAFGEWDSYRVAAGVLEAVRDDASVGESGIRNNSVSYAYSFLLLAFGDAVRRDPTSLYPIMNYVNVIAATLATLPFLVVMRRYFGLTAAVGATLTLIVVPVWWNLALYAHPMMPAALVFLCALAAVGLRDRFVRATGSSAAGIAVDAAVVGLLALTLMFRLDAVLLFPMLTACLRLEGRSWLRSFAESIGWAVLALAIFIGVRQAIFPAGGALGNVLGSLERWHDPARLLPNLVRGTTIFVLACHPLFVALFGVGAVLLVRRRAWDALFFLVPTIAINYLFWLPNPSPSRHFMYVAPVLAAGVGVAVAMLVRGSATVWGARIAAVGVAASLVPASLLLAEAYFPLLQRAYPWKYGVQDYSARAPIRAITANKARTEEYFRSASRIGETLAGLSASDRPYLVIVDPRPVQVELLMHAPESESRLRLEEELGRSREFPVVRTRRNEFHLLDIEDDLPLRVLEIEGDFSRYTVIVDEGNPSVAHVVSEYDERTRAALNIRPVVVTADR